MSSLYKHKVHGYRIRYKVYFTDSTFKIKLKHHKSKRKAIIAQQDTDKLEVLSKSHRFTHEELAYFVHSKYITQDEARDIVHHEIALADPDTITWEKLAEVYLQHLDTVGSETTKASGQYRLTLISKYFKNIPPLNVNKETIKGFVAASRKTRASGTINKYLNVLRIMLDYPVEKGLLVENPARKIKNLPESQVRIPRILYPEEFEKFLAGLKEHAYLLHGYFPELLLTYVYTGMRRRELIHLKTTDINLSQKYLNIRNPTHIKSGRKIDIHPHLIQIFNSVIEKNKDFRKKYATGKIRIGEEYFFGGLNRTFVREDAVTKAFTKFRQRINLSKEITLHTLRHTFITYLLRHLLSSGSDIKQAMKYSGHKNLATIDRYLHIIPSDKPPIEGLQFPSLTFTDIDKD